ncbi:MAG: histone H1-like repetitive region-containing protein [Acidimicrobiia bacterium]|nr:histone H1-like repetitive region-containing protein [Acidimicrobiia bacterium]
MTAKRGPAHLVVDGSNIATEGRSLPSLTQLNDAVMSFMAEHPDTAITVVVDATFGHRIDKKEVPEFEEGISNNELVAPPAGAVGRGDAFVLGIADKAKATVLSNDSFQEFHGDYTWLFDEGRLVGGKPVPHVGWVFVDRVPVRGPVSRQATGGARRGRSQSKSGSRSGSKSSRSGARSSKSANQPMPVPSEPPPGATSSSATEGSPAPRRGEAVNELLPFLEFVEHHPIGTSINGTVDAYSSHGAYISIGDEGVRGYIPLRLMADPAPRSARNAMKLGESVTAVVTSFAPARRSIDCAMPDMSAQAIAEAADGSDREPENAGKDASAPKKPAAKKAPSKKAATAKKATPTKQAAAKKPASESPPAKKAATAKKSAAKKAPAKKTAPKKAPAEDVATAPKSAAKKTVAKKSVAKKAPAKAVAKKSVAKKAPAKKTVAKKSEAKKAVAKKAPAKKTVAKKTSATRGTATTAQPDRHD